MSNKKKLIIGFAGSGKSGYIKSKFDAQSVLYHDEWAKIERTKEETIDFIEALFCRNFSTAKYKDLSSLDIVTMLSKDPHLAQIYREYFKIRFARRMEAELQSENGADIFECPYLDFRIQELKGKYKFEVVKISRELGDCISFLKEHRNWSDDRINMTISCQLVTFAAYGHLIDKKIDSSEIFSNLD